MSRVSPRGCCANFHSRMGSHLTIQQSENFFDLCLFCDVAFQSFLITARVGRDHRVIAQSNRPRQLHQFHSAQPPPKRQHHVPSRVPVTLSKFIPLFPFHSRMGSHLTIQQSENFFHLCLFCDVAFQSFL